MVVISFIIIIYNRYILCIPSTQIICLINENILYWFNVTQYDYQITRCSQKYFTYSSTEDGIRIVKWFCHQVVGLNVNCWC